MTQMDALAQQSKNYVPLLMKSELCYPNYKHHTHKLSYVETLTSQMLTGKPHAHLKKLALTNRKWWKK